MQMFRLSTHPVQVPHPIMHRGLKLNSAISVGNIKNIKLTGAILFSTRELGKKCRNFIKRVVTMTKIQFAWEASHHLTLMDKHFMSNAKHLFTYLYLCVRFLRVVAVI